MFFWGAKNRYYTQLCCSARVRSWPLADMPASDSPFTLAISGSFQASDVFAAEIRAHAAGHCTALTSQPFLPVPAAARPAIDRK